MSDRDEMWRVVEDAAADPDAPPTGALTEASLREAAERLEAVGRRSWCSRS